MPRAGGNATHHYLRRLHNLAVNLGWLAWPILANKAWPRLVTARRRAVTADEHARIIASEKNIERRAYCELLWETGCSQSDGAKLRGEDIDRNQRVLIYHRMKLGEDSQLAQLSIGHRLWELLSHLPVSGKLFVTISNTSAKMRAAEFRRRCKVAGISGISLHCYRRAWAQRAKSAGYPQRFAQAALGPSSRAVHEAYARDSIVVCPPLEA